MYCRGQKKINRDTTDGWYRTFRGYPEISKAGLKMLKEYIVTKEFGKIMLFFQGHCDFSEDYSGFLLRELIRGNI